MLKAKKEAFLQYLEDKYQPSLVNAIEVFKVEASISGSLKKMDSNYSSIFNVEEPAVVERLLFFIQSPSRGAMARGKLVKNMDLKLAFLNHYKQFIVSWGKDTEKSITTSGDEVFVEGLMKETTFFHRKRNRALRDECIRKYGHICYVCGFDFESHYGPRGHDFIEVHHLHPVSDYDQAHNVSVDDLRPLCSNCHSMIHKDPVHKLTDIEVFKAEYKKRNHN